MNKVYFDDNFGCYEIRDDDDIDFYFETQLKSVWKRCKGCKRKVKLLPDYAYCNSCTQGFDIGE